MWLKEFLQFPLKIILIVRHKLYDDEILCSRKASIRTIVVGSLQLGGTGKTPMALWLSKNFDKAAILSRGYKRKTKGFLEVDTYQDPETFGDEPSMLRKLAPKDVKIFVGEDRLKAVDEIKKRYPETQVVILDDGLQHRALRPDYSILTYSQGNPYQADYLFPFGTLRDIKSRSKQVDFELSIAPLDYLLSFDPKPTNEISVFCGIAQPNRLKIILEQQVELNQFKIYDDHFQYTRKDIDFLLNDKSSIWYTTEKDFVKIERIIEPRERPRFGLIKMELEVKNSEQLLFEVREKLFKG